MYGPWPPEGVAVTDGNRLLVPIEDHPASDGGSLAGIDPAVQADDQHRLVQVGSIDPVEQAHGDDSRASSAASTSLMTPSPKDSKPGGWSGMPIPWPDR